MRSQAGNVRSSFPTGATGMIFLLHQRQMLFYKSLSKRLSTLHSNGASLPAILVRGAVIHSVSVPSDVVKRRCDFWRVANAAAAALKWSRRVEIPNVSGGAEARRPLFYAPTGKRPVAEKREPANHSVTETGPS